MSIEDKRRRLNGSAETTGQLTVAELIARREAETMPIPVITDDITPEAFEPTVKFTPVKPRTSDKVKAVVAKELHITELLRREGRADDTQRGGFTVGKLAAAASGGVVLCGTMAFGASSWLSSPDERPLADVRFDERAQARGASSGTEGVVKLPSNKTQMADATAEATEDPTSEPTKPRVAPYTQQQQRPTQQQTQAPTQTQQPTSETQTPTTPPSTAETTPSQPSTPPSSSTPAPPSSSATPPPSSSTPPPSENPLPTPSNPVDVSVDLGILDPVLSPLGEFDFFAPAN